MKLKPLSLNAYTEITNNEAAPSLYVINRTETEIVFSVPGSQGLETIIISHTWVPQDLTAQCPRKALIEAPQLRTLVNSRRISIVAATVSPTDKKDGYSGAEDILGTDRGRKEADRINESTRSTEYATANGEIEDDIDLSGVIGSGNDANPRKSPSQNSDISIAAKSIVTRDANGDDTDGLINALATKAPTLTRNDLQYVVDRATSTALKDEAATLLHEKS